MKNAAYDIIAAKGSTHYGIAISLARITRSILKDEHAVLPVSVHLEGQYQATDVCISSPPIVNSQGIREIIEMPLNESEQQQMYDSIQTLKTMQAQLQE